MPHFKPKSEPTNTSTRWSQWLERFEQYLKATNITTNARKRALLLYQAGPEVYDIFKTIPNTGADDAYDTTVQKLTEYFEPDQNRIYQTYVFRQTIQGSTETLDAYHTKLRGLAKFCDFHDADFEIKMQIVLHGTSSRCSIEHGGTRTFFHMVDQYFGNDSLEPFESKFIGSTGLAMTYLWLSWPSLMRGYQDIYQYYG